MVDKGTEKVSHGKQSMKVYLGMGFYWDIQRMKLDR